MDAQLLVEELDAARLERLAGGSMSSHREGTIPGINELVGHIEQVAVRQ